MTHPNRPRRPHVRAAFTLVEILIVVVILGVIATIVIASFNNTTGEANAAALKADLRTIRGAIQVYQAQHGTYPAVATFSDQMTQYSDPLGGTSATRTG